jgi:2-alkenal reductase
MGRTNTFILIVVLLLTLVGGAVLGALAGAGVSLYLIQKRLSQPVTVVASQTETRPLAPTLTSLPAAIATIPTAVPAASLPQNAVSTGEDIPAMIARVGDAVVTVENSRKLIDENQKLLEQLSRIVQESKASAAAGK